MATKRLPVSKRIGRISTTPQKNSVQQVQALTRGLMLLECVGRARDGVTLSDLAMQIGLAASTTHRLLNTLEHMRFVYQEPEQGKWYIGVNAFHVGSAFINSRDVITQSRPLLRQLMEQSGETTNIAVLDDGEAVMLAQVQCHEMMRMVVPLGRRMPLHASAVGKSLLADMPETEIVPILHQRGLPQFTANTLVTPTELYGTLRDIRAQGYAYDNEEHAVGLRCVAATIYDEHGEPLAAISISGPSSRILDRRVAELGLMVARTATEMTETVGGQTPTQHLEQKDDRKSVPVGERRE